MSLSVQLAPAAFLLNQIMTIQINSRHLNRKDHGTNLLSSISISKFTDIGKY